MFVDGEWQPDTETTTDDEGQFIREETEFRDQIGVDVPAEPGRYHLYIARPCPWAHGTVLVRTLTGLSDVISMDILDPYREAEGWQFSPDRDDCTPDTVNGLSYLREAYVAADPAFTGRVSVPVLWDKHQNTIVNNESIEIMRMLDRAFDEHKTRDVTLYPEALEAEIDDVVEQLYESVNNGVYRAGFAKTQAAYDQAVSELFDALDHWESVLADQRYLVGDRLTLADLRLFATLVRFDSVYHTHFKCNVRRIVDYPNLWNFTKELYQLPGVAETVNMQHITEHYYMTHTSINPKQIIAAGPDLDFTEPHDRGRLAGTPPIA